MAGQGARHLLNTAWLVGAGATSKLLFLLATIVIYKGLPLRDSGAFGLAYAFGTTFVILAELGLRGYATRELAKLRAADTEAAQELFSGVLLLRLLLGVLVCPVALAAIFLLGYESRLIPLFASLLVFAILDSFAVLLKAILRAYERMEIDAFASIVSRTIILVLLLASFFHGSLDLVSVGVYFVTAALLECALLIYLLHRLLPLRMFSSIPARASLRNVFTRSLPFALLVAVGILYIRTSVFALSKVDLLRELLPWAESALPNQPGTSPFEAVAFFTAAARVPEALSFLPIAMVNAVIPFFSRNSTNLELVQKTFTSVLRYLGMAGIPIAGVLLAEPEYILQLIAKAEFTPAAPALQLLACAIPMTFTSYIFANLLICMGEERLVMKRYLCILGVNILLNFVLTPVWAAAGAALAFVLSEASALVFDSLALRRKRIRIPVEVILSFFAVGGLVALTAIGSESLPPPVRIALILTVGAGSFLTTAWKRDRETCFLAVGKALTRFKPAK